MAHRKSDSESVDCNSQRKIKNGNAWCSDRRKIDKKHPEASQVLVAGGGFASTISAILSAGGLYGLGIAAIISSLVTLCVIGAVTMFSAVRMQKDSTLDG
jgi:hypothetical protein